MIQKNKVIAALISTLILLSACSKKPTPKPEPNPHEGMVQVSNGMGGLMWAPIFENLDLNKYDADSFYSDGAFLNYSDPEFSVAKGIDVSFYQKSIDWNLVAQNDIDFAMIRAGFRGTTVGNISVDEMFFQNIEGALNAGLDVGVYFFSQAVNTQEAIEEAEFVLDLVSDYNISLPIAFDWENEGRGDARTDNLPGSLLTDCALAFCDRISSAGYEPAVYFYKKLGYYEYDLDKIADIKFWVAAPGEYPDFYYDHFMWQYSFTGNVNGIDEPVDLNLYFEKNPSLA